MRSPGGAPEYVATGAVTFPVTVADTNAGLSLTPRAVTVREGGTVQDTYTVALSVAPSGPVTVTASVTSGDTKVALDTDASPQTRVLEVQHGELEYAADGDGARDERRRRRGRGEPGPGEDHPRGGERGHAIQTTRSARRSG